MNSMKKGLLRAGRAIRKFSCNIIVEDGILFYKNKGKEHKRQWVPEKEKHATAGGCHFGRDKTREKVVSKYYWHGQCEDIDNYVKSCEKCQKVIANT